MQKETIIVILIVILIFLGNIITQRYTSKSVAELNEKLDGIKNQIISLGKDQMNNDEIKNMVKEAQEDWNSKHDKMAYYIEHNELEKVDTAIIILSADLETNHYEEAISKIEESKFVLKHIQEKYAFSLQNVF